MWICVLFVCFCLNHDFNKINKINKIFLTTKEHEGVHEGTQRVGAGLKPAPTCLNYDLCDLYDAV